MGVHVCVWLFCIGADDVVDMGVRACVWMWLGVFVCLCAGGCGCVCVCVRWLSVGVCVCVYVSVCVCGYRCVFMGGFLWLLRLVLCMFLGAVVCVSVVIFVGCRCVCWCCSWMRVCLGMVECT